MKLRGIRGKLLAGFIVVLVIIALQAVNEYRRSHRVERLLDMAVRVSAEEGKAAMRMTQAAISLSSKLEGAGETGPADVMADIAAMKQALRGAMTATEASIKSYEGLGDEAREAEERMEIKELRQMQEMVEGLEQEWRRQGTGGLPNVRKNMVEQMERKLLPMVLAYERRSLEEVTEDGKMATATIRQSRYLLVTMVATALAAAAVAVVLLARSMTKPLVRMRREAEAISQGDFTRRITPEGGDEYEAVAEAFNRTLDSLQAAMEAERELERLFDLSLDMLCVADFTGRFVRVNTAFERVLGYTREEMVSRPFADFIHPEDREVTEGEMRKYRESGKPSVEFENRYRHKDGSWKTISWNAVPVQETGRVYAAARDITEQRRAEEAVRNLNATLEDRIMERTEELRESEERFRLMIEQLQDYAIFLLSPEGVVVTWNNAAERIKGYKADEIVGKYYGCFFLKEDRDAGLPTKLLEEARVNGRERSEGWRQRKDGTRFWAEATITALRDERGTLKGYAKVTRDLTERRKGELALQAALERQRELTREAQAGERAKSEFLAVMSHEIRTPMNGLIGYAGLLAEAGDLSAQNREYVETLQASGQALLRILDDILDLARVDAGKVKIEERGFGLRELIGDVCQLVEPAAERKGLRLETEVAEDLPARVMGDEGRLRQVLLNLAGNAIKFTEQGGVSVKAGRSGEDESWEVSVRDTGPGIKEEYMKKLFEPFYQGDASASRRHGGTGLGLAISRRLVELMGGTLTVKSREGEGSVFTVRVPLKEAPEERVPVAHEGARDGGKGFARRHPLKILVAEDDAINLKLTLTLLKRLGYEDALAARNGREAVEVALREKPTCVLMDVQMPEMSGIEATAEIRKQLNGGAGKVFIAALTANTNEADRQRCFEAGMSAHLNKPIRNEQLRELLERACKVVGCEGHGEA